MTISQVGNSCYKVERIDYGVHICDKCGKDSGCLKSVRKLGGDKKPIKLCYQCTGNHWKRALKIFISEFESKSESQS